MAYGQILGPQLDPEFDPEALRGLGAENRVLKVRTNSPFLFSFIYIKKIYDYYCGFVVTMHYKTANVKNVPYVKKPTNL